VADQIKNAFRNQWDMREAVLLSATIPRLTAELPTHNSEPEITTYIYNVNNANTWMKMRKFIRFSFPDGLSERRCPK